MKSLLDRLEFYETVVFDLDGCIYDEFDFISQRYHLITNELVSKAYRDNILEWMLENWLTNGSSDDTLFRRIELEYVKSVAVNFETKALKLYREKPINLELSNRTKFIFNQLQQRNVCFMMVTDGNSKLQRLKFNSLGLAEFFSEKDIVFTGDLGTSFYKPHPAAYTKLVQGVNGRAVYLGDREIDRLFAKNIGLDFIKVRNMIDG
jgi:phosphoglycolate phosphatase-like HAD superfamily hydrolase